MFKAMVRGLGNETPNLKANSNICVFQRYCRYQDINKSSVVWEN